MANGIARYTVMNGLSGCYMPDSVGAYEFTSRKQLAEFICEQLEWLDWPRSKFREANLRNVWHHIARYGSSSAHFSIQHKGYSLQFAGLTDAEYEAAQAEQD